MPSNRLFLYATGAAMAAAAALAPAASSAKGPTYHAAEGMPFSEAVQVGDMLYLSGQIGVAPGETTLAAGGIAGETRQTMDNIGAVLARHGLGFDDVVKCTVMLADMNDWPAFNAVYVGYFKPDRLPARSAFGSTGLAYGGRVELECWAYSPQAKARR
ncbi:MAG: RidA family protein [Cypionkella sp.]|uniref:RidA family protein n=1 Tax=Cypionkella sp. TaxID=2811411 RepID=UPI002ABAE3C7|nr:RidA family protein [Cypionkella sp.]MDZ4311541.1 RidA family protein [Cypionkella sp.]